MVEKCPPYSALPSPGLPYNACYKHVHSVPLSLSTTPPASATLPSSPGMGLMTTSNAPKFGTVIPSRIFVGGIDFKTSEEDLQKFFSAFGSVRDTKIIRDRADVSKGYGFVTFSSTEEVNKVMDQEECLYLNGKKLNIGPAIRKQQIYLPKDMHVPGPVCSWVVHPGGYASYTNANGITYFLPTPQLQMIPPQQSYVMAYNSATAQPIAQYGGFSQNASAIQPISNNVALPWSPTQAGSCGQIITPVQALDHNQAIGMLPLASATSNTNVSRTQLAAPATPGASVVAAPAALTQAHIQVPTTYVCSPMPGQQSLPVRIAPNVAAQPVLQPTEQPQPLMHSMHYSQQMSTLNQKGHAQISSNGDIPALALGSDANIIPAAYGIQQAVYPGGGMVGISDVNGAHIQYAPIASHPPSEMTPPPTPESQSKLK